ncbi:hypothetical protein SAMN02927900_04603 [Rhizobium mongolense subsp. loessense]|uniref:Uncharacterized protein n=1 Tax=Rhizobium mongolense subsp. loessense TaxID=158890 RepID=A0A1G4T6C6_9HYPH|nr:hypothetical protein SAMN02927900_04603 [Rhizobium mongolense subsp. loessense]
MAASFACGVVVCEDVNRATGQRRQILWPSQPQTGSACTVSRTEFVGIIVDINVHDAPADPAPDCCHAVGRRALKRALRGQVS